LSRSLAGSVARRGALASERGVLPGKLNPSPGASLRTGARLVGSARARRFAAATVG
jgi:hypothetical protein